MIENEKKIIPGQNRIRSFTYVEQVSPPKTTAPM